MNYRDAIYSPLSSLVDLGIKELESTLDNQESEELDKVLEFYYDVNDQLEEAYLAVNSNKIFNAIKNSLEELMSSEAVLIKKMIKLVSLSLFVEDNVEDLDASISICPENFTLSEYNGVSLPFYAFAHLNNLNNIDSIAYIDLGDIGEINFNENSYGFNNEILSILISKLNEVDGLSNKYILHRSDVFNYKRIESAFKTLCVMNRHVIHKPIISNSVYDITSFLDDITCEKSFNQFDESLIIISEINDRKDILGKFMNIYHVIESFMNKVPLVYLSNNNNGNVFKLRDFKRLYGNISKSELNSIINLFKCPEIGTKYWDVQVGSHVFSDLVKSKLTMIESHNDFNLSECDRFLSHFDLYDSNYFNQLKNGVNEAKYATLIYKVRCALVHNTETEYHISHFNLSASDSLFIDEILISPLITLISRLITDDGSNVWYKGQDLSLYG